MSVVDPPNPTILSPPIRPIPRHLLAWIMWGTSALFVLFQFFLQLSSGEIVAGLMKSFSLSAFGGGVLASTYYYVYALLQTPAGLLIDRFGPRRLLSAGAFVCAVGCLLFGISGNLAVAVLGRLLMGTGAAFAFVGSLSVIGKWFPPSRFAFMAAIAETVGMAGTLVGGFFLATWVQRMGWRHSMIAASGIMAVIGGIIWLVVRDAPPEEVASSPFIEPPKRGTALWKDLYVLVKNTSVWVNGLYSGLMFSIVTVFVALWAIPFIQVAYHLDLVMSSMVCNLVFIGIAIAGPLVGWMEARIANRRTLLRVSSFASAIFLVTIIYVPGLPLVVLMLLMILLGVFASGYVLTFGIASEIVPRHLRGSSLGFVNALSVGSAPVLQPLVGLILHLSASQSELSAEYYSVHDYQVALIVIPLLIFLAGILVKWIPNRNAIS